ncbi:MAG TPA: Rieske (2Fe-2S) protein [Asanoa sp.]
MSDEQAVTEPGATRRRALLVGAGFVGTAAVLAACGTDNQPTTTAPSVATTTGAEPEPSDDTGDDTGGSTSNATVLGKRSDVPVGGGAIFSAEQVVVTQPAAGTFKGFRSVCTHQGCPIASVEGGTINCTCHGSKFSLTDGTPANGPATRPLTSRPVKVDGDNIVLG